MTPIPASVTHVVQSLGPTTDQVREVSFNDEDGSWAVVMDDESEVLVEWDDAPSRLLLSSLLGAAPHGREPLLYTSALAYSGAGMSHGGVTVGLGGAGGELMLMLQLSADALLLQDLQKALLHFHATTLEWTRFVAGDTDTRPTVQSDDLPAASLLAGAPLPAMPVEHLAGH